MKLLSVIVPSYNSQDYLEKCLESLLSVKEDSLEILIINDGSQDRTGEIADSFAFQYPDIVKTVHQENKGHGGAVNTGIEKASGLYVKVVDSDDWIERESFEKILTTLKGFVNNKQTVDLLISNFVYEKEGAKQKKAVSFENALPQDRIFTWDEIGLFRKGQYLLMHALIYRKQVLTESALKLPEHTFYVDNLFAYLPLDFVHSLYYLNVNLYRYYIGREDQSVNESVMIKRIDQQLKVNWIMIEERPLNLSRNINLQLYMLHYLEIITTVSSILLIRSKKPEYIRKKRELWRSIKDRDRQLYHRLRFGLLGHVVNLPGRMGRYISIELYKLSQRAFGFN